MTHEGAPRVIPHSGEARASARLFAPLVLILLITVAFVTLALTILMREQVVSDARSRAAERLEADVARAQAAVEARLAQLHMSARLVATLLESELSRPHDEGRFTPSAPPLRADGTRRIEEGPLLGMVFRGARWDARLRHDLNAGRRVLSRSGPLLERSLHILTLSLMSGGTVAWWPQRDVTVEEIPPTFDNRLTPPEDPARLKPHWSIRHARAPRLPTTLRVAVSAWSEGRRVGWALLNYDLEALRESVEIEGAEVELVTHEGRRARWHDALPAACLRDALDLKALGPVKGRGCGDQRVLSAPLQPMGWRLVYAPKPGAFAGVTRGPLRLIIAFGIFLALMVLLAAWLFIRQVSRPLLQTRAALEAMGREERDYTLPTARDDAIGILAREIERMHQELQRHRADELAIERRTHQQQRLESLGRLSAGVAHDFNNILTVIKGWSSLLQVYGEGEVEARVEAVEAVLTAVDSAEGLTRQLLSFGRPSAVTQGPRSVDEIAAGIRRMLGRILEASYEITLHPAGEPLYAKLSSTGVEQILLNLALNARDAMPEGGHISISLRRVGEGALALDVEDTGEGMSPEVVDKVLQPFFSTKGAAGTGIGLATVHDLATGVGGDVEISSAVGVGTLVSVTLPLARPAQEAPAREAPEARGARPAWRLLVLEDDEAVSRMVEAGLTSAGHAVRVVNVPDEALGMDPASIDLMISDVDLPGCSGVEVVEALRARRPDLPALFITGHGPSAALKAVDPALIVPKPFRIEALTSRIDEVMMRMEGEDGGSA